MHLAVMSYVFAVVALVGQTQSSCFSTRAFASSSRKVRGSAVNALKAVATDVSPSLKKVAIVGGGLGGLSVATHLLLQQKNDRAVCDSSSIRIDQLAIFDSSGVGTGGASAVAGGFIHPLSPRGKLLHRGREGLAATTDLVRLAEEYQAATFQSKKLQVVLQDEIYRLALTDKHLEQLKATAETEPDFAEWLDQDHEVVRKLASQTTKSAGTQSNLKGALRLHNGCKVIHVPSYLKSLWLACEEIASTLKIDVEWNLTNDTDVGFSFDSNFWRRKLAKYDIVVMAAGSGLFDHADNKNGSQSGGLLPEEVALPVQCVRGQSLEVRLPSSVIGDTDSQVAAQLKNDVPVPALLCEKYISHLPSSKYRFLVGATQEFKEAALEPGHVAQELRDRTYDMWPDLWTLGKVENVTSGMRVQSNRGQHGRLPIVGKLEHGLPNYLPHDNTWILTGLSSRGLLYHALCGKVLSKAILFNDESLLADEWSEILWWKR